jgi:DNA mismatch repair protein MutS2
MVEKEKTIVLGSYVKISGTNFRGILLKQNIKTNICEIEVEGKVIKVDFSLLKLISEKVEKKNQKKHRSLSHLKSNKKLSLDLHGYTKIQAHEALIIFIDKALTKNINKIEIIHGHGSGIIKETVHSFLTKCNLVSSYKVEELNTGVTTAYLK